MAVNLLVDTSAYSGFNRGDNRLQAFFKAENTLTVPLVVIGELRAGFAAGKRQGENEKLLRRFLDSPNVLTVGVSDSTTHHYAEIFRSLRKAGRPIGTNDMWIAAIALEQGLPLLTLDQDFAAVSRLELIQL